MKKPIVVFVLLISIWSKNSIPSSEATDLQSGPSKESTIKKNGERLRIIISDLHFGVGKDPSTQNWYAEEDFRWRKEFELFLQQIDKMGKGETDLILNGDVFELWQSKIICQANNKNTPCQQKHSLKLHKPQKQTATIKDCRYDNPNLGCTEEEANDRLKAVIKAHQPEMKALQDFATRKNRNNRIIIIPGNHDAGLLLPSLANTVYQAIQAPGKIQIESAGYWLSPDGLIYAEHGHQIGEEVNSWKSKWPKPFIQENGKIHLIRPWGEKFVQDYYNEFEKKYPIIDNISEESEGIWYGMAAEGGFDTIRDIGGFLKFFLFKVSWDQFTNALGERTDEHPKWNIQCIKGLDSSTPNIPACEKNQGPRFLVESIPRDHPLYKPTKNAFDKGELSNIFSSLSDENIKNICNERAALHSRQMKEGSTPTITLCPQKSGKLSAIAQGLLRARDDVISDHLKFTCLALTKCRDNPFKVFIFSHTHLAVPPYQLKTPPWKPNPTVINTGAWQRVVTPDQLDLIKATQKLSAREVLRKLEPEDLVPACYSFVMIEPYSDKEIPIPRLRFWVKNQTEKDSWKIAKTCDLESR